MNENKALTERLASMTQDRDYDQAPEQEHIEQVEQIEEVHTAPEETESAPEQTEAAPVVSQAQQQKEGGHFKKLRESLERSEREKQELQNALLKMLDSQRPAAPEAPRYTEPELEDNDFVPRNYVDRKLRETQQQLSQYQQALYEQMVASQLQTQYTDFSTVLSKDNIAKLRQEHPEIAASLAANPDIATKAQATYKIIKKLGLDVPEPDYEPVKQKIQANTQKPRPATANPLSYASNYDYQRMSDDEMKRERQAMEDAIRG